MFKKVLLVAALGVGTLFAVHKFKDTKFGAKVKDGVATLAECFDSNDSKRPEDLEKKVAKLRKDVTSLDKEIDKAGGELAKEIVETDYLMRDIAKETATIADEEKKVRAAGEALSTSTEKVVSYGRLNVSVAEAKQYLADDVKRIVTRKESLATMKETLVSRLRIREVLTKQVETIRNQKRDVTLAIEKVEADIKSLQLAQMESKYQFDDTKLSKVKASLAEIQKDVDIQRTKLKLAPTIAGEAGAPSTSLSVDEILSGLDAKANPRSN